MNPIAAIEADASPVRFPGRRSAPSAHFPATRSMFRGFAFGLAALSLAASPLHAGEFSAMAGESIDLGRFHGVIYYTAETDGHHVVATIADDAEGSPLRFSATLAENQSATLSVAGRPGEPARSLTILRAGGRIILSGDKAASSGATGSRAEKISQ